MNRPVLHHIHVFCTELEPMIAFFEAACGAALVSRRTYGDGVLGAAMTIGVAYAPDLLTEARLNLKQLPCARPETVMAGMNHIGFAVKNLEAACEAACAAPGARLDTPPTLGAGLRYAFIRGPEDILVELVELM